MSKKVFTPTPAQKKTVFEKLCTGEIAQSVRLEIINPETKKPVCLDNFCEMFEEEILNARAIRGTKVCSNLFNGATYVSKNRITGVEERDSKCIQQWLALDGRGLFGKKFKLNPNDTMKEQFKQIKMACANGLIGSQEMTAFGDICVKEMQAIEFEQIKQEFADLKAVMKANK